MTADYTLYLVTDPGVIQTGSLQKAVEQAILGGCTMVQLREKESKARAFYELAGQVKAVTDRYRVPLIINNRIDIALAVDAAGVHLGQKDIPAAAARKLIGNRKILGVSASTAQAAVKAQRDGADYLGVGAMHPTVTKKDADSVTAAELQKIRRAVSVPIVVIGGINRDNAGTYRSMGVNGLAVISAVLAQPDIRRAAAEMKRIFLEN